MQENKGSSVGEQYAYVFSERFGNHLSIVDIENGDKYGYFSVKFKYLPTGLFITLESAMGRFTVDIEDCDKARNSLYRIEAFDNRTNNRNINNAAKILERKLKENDIPLFVFESGKIYKKYNGELKRVRSVME